MNIEPDLIKKILLDAKNLPENQIANGFTYENKDQNDVDKHTLELIEKDFLKGFLIRETKTFFRISGITEKGENFLKKCSEEEITSLKSLQS